MCIENRELVKYKVKPKYKFKKRSKIFTYKTNAPYCSNNCVGKDCTNIAEKGSAWQKITRFKSNWWQKIKKKQICTKRDNLIYVQDVTL